MKPKKRPTKKASASQKLRTVEDDKAKDYTVVEYANGMRQQVKRSVAPETRTVDATIAKAYGFKPISEWKASAAPESDATEHDCPKCGEHFSVCICEAQDTPELPHSPLPWVHTHEDGCINDADGNLIASEIRYNEGKLIVASVNNAAFFAKASEK